MDHKHKCASSKSLGEVSTGEGGHGTDFKAADYSVKETKATYNDGTEAGAAAGGGNTPCGAVGVVGGTDCV